MRTTYTVPAKDAGCEVSVSRFNESVSLLISWDDGTDEPDELGDYGETRAAAYLTDDQARELIEALQTIIGK